jgi:hypothetical protein
MYSPKISEKHIPYLYRLARHLRMPMTKLVDQILEGTIEALKANGIFEDVEKEEQVISALRSHFARLVNCRKVQKDEVADLLRKIA